MSRCLLTTPCATGRRRGQTPAQRLMSSYSVEPAGCWLWTGRVAGNGYGQISINNRYQQAHRLVFELARGPIPARKQLDHLCRKPLCVNPAHLEPVDQATNVRRGRASRLSPSAVANIRVRHAGGTSLRAIARELQLDHSTLSRALRGETWAV